MNNIFTKISLFIIISTFICSCNIVKKVPEGKHLLVDNKILVNDKKNSQDELLSNIMQKPNTSILGYRLRLNMFNLSKKNTDSIFKAKYSANPAKYYRKSKWLSKKQVNRLGKSFWYSGWHSFLRETGEPPVIIDETKTQKTTKRLKAYYLNQGYFDAQAKFKIEYKENKRGLVNYSVTTGKPTYIDTLSREIETPALDSLYLITQSKSLIKKGQQYNVENFEAEQVRITNYFTDNGVRFFQQKSVVFIVDTLNNNYKAPVKINITNQTKKVGDSLISVPYKIYRIGEVNIFTTDNDSKNKTKIADSARYKNFNLFSTDKLKYKPKAITDAVFVLKDSLYSNKKHSLTLKSINNLRIFKYPNIIYVEDTLKQTLKANIYLTAIEKYKFGANVDFTHSNIQDIGITGSTSVSIRNLFKRAEILEIGFRANIGSSKKLANPNNQFFNILEFGADMRLSFPRLWLPFKTDKIIPKTMFPASYISSSFTKQTNIGLDKENFTATVNYNWKPKEKNAAKLDIVNLQYVKNINIDNYFNVYGSSYTILNKISKNYPVDSEFLDTNGDLTKTEGGATNFINSALNNVYPSLTPTSADYKAIKSIKERKDRLTENNLIFASNFTYSKDTKSDLFDKEFYSIRNKIELAGNVFSLAANLSNQPKSTEGSRTLFGLEYSQYAKGEIEYVKHWDLTQGKTIAIRSFFGIAIPYGNSKSVPFSRSYFAGGSNDNRAWESYSLGQGSSGGLNDFNEANMKIALNAEFRFKYFGSLYGAFFADAGNIWNVLDNETDETKIFTGLKSLKSLALGTGIGFRYDFKFFLARLDFGFKTYNPAKIETQRWFKEYNLSQSIVNIGINYPF
ncbi:BamA/TamA family outer membrane protein [Flavobacterium sp.]|uniref:translocation and assembly module lipoprotein TamL n=1 Tax=Flavobacterium sp. TaxID=239 RepID=UPI00286E72B1|nr:BamA/TamA family outer membrane protein [Flavobacterium sp.]